MANNYCQFSFQFNVGELNKKVFDMYSTTFVDDELHQPEWMSDDLFNQLFDCECFPFSLELEKEAIWIYAEEYGDVEILSNFLKDVMRFLNVDGGIYFTWANTCSKLRPNEFFGGACVATKDKTLFMFPEAWAVKTLKELNLTSFTID